MATITEMTEYLGKDRFVKFTNTDDYPELDSTTKDILKNNGVLSREFTYPFLQTDGKLKKLGNGLLQIGTGRMENPFCIDKNNKFVGYNLKTKKIRNINSTLQKYIETLYTYRKYCVEISQKEILGDYYKNHKKYAKKLQEMLEEVEPDIMKYETWNVIVFEIELGVM